MNYQPNVKMIDEEYPAKHDPRRGADLVAIIDDGTA